MINPGQSVSNSYSKAFVFGCGADRRPIEDIRAVKVNCFQERDKCKTLVFCGVQFYAIRPAPFTEFGQSDRGVNGLVNKHAINKKARKLCA